MDELKRALYALIHQTDLTETEVTSLTINDLHLAGTEPHLLVWDEKTGQRRTISLEDETRNAIVTWMLMRPDRPVPLLFPSEENDIFTEEAIATLLQDYSPPEKPQPAESTAAVSSQTITEEGLPEAGPPSVKPEASSAAQTTPPFKTLPPSSSPEQMPGPNQSDISASDPPAADKPRGETTPVKEKPGPVSPVAESTPPSTKPASKPSRFRKFYLPIIVVILIIIACGGLIVGGIVIFPEQSTTLTEQFPSLAGQFTFLREEFERLIGQEGGDETPVAQAEVEEAVVEPPVVTSTSPVSTPTPEPTPTIEPTETPTLLPTDTPIPVPTETLTPEPTPTPIPIPTDTPTPEPTVTPEPTQVPTDVPTDTPVSASPPGQITETETVTVTPTIGFKYSAPELIWPEPDFIFIKGNTIDLEWESVGELAGDEQYAVRLVYSHEGKVVYRGTQLRETLWTVPLELYHDADGPHYDYVWYVYVERIQPDGTGVSISPESEHLHFKWD